MSVKWTGSQSESGILRKSEYKEKKEELFVFGYACKLFRDDEKALLIDQGKHLIPWMGDETLKIDRYDARGALHDLSSLEAPPGGYDWRVELTRMELDVEQRCDEERYRALHTDEDEEEMYKEEELKRLHAAGYGQVGFNYDTPSEPEPATQSPAEIDEPFVPAPSYKALFNSDIVFPETEKQNVIIEKTAKFIASQGAQMEILIKAKQGDNPQFQFLSRDAGLHPYYMALIGLIKAGKWPEKTAEVVEEKPHEYEDYLHPSLASTIIESAPSIPSIHYKPSSDCDYTMLICKMRGEATLDEAYEPPLAPGELPPPGTEPPPPPLPLPASHLLQHLPPPLSSHAQISRPPMMYNQVQAPDPIQQTAQYQQQYAAYYQQYMAQNALNQAAALQTQVQVPPPLHKPPPTKDDEPSKPAPLKSTGLSLMKNYNTDSDSDVSDFDDSSSTDSKEKPIIATPPEDVRVVIDKMAAYVARNGDEFAAIVRAKNDPRFTFLEPTDVHHAFYLKLMREKRGDDVNKNSAKALVSFSIKKLKEPDPILPKPALPYESSSDEEDDSKSDQQTEKQEKESPKTNIPQTFTPANMPPVIVYKMESTINANNLPAVKAIETAKVLPKPAPLTPPVLPEVKQVIEEKIPEKLIQKDVVQETVVAKNEEVKRSSPENKVVEIEKEKEREISRDVDNHIEKSKDKESRREKSKETEKNRDVEKKKLKVKKKEYNSKPDRDYKRATEREKKRERASEKVKKRKKYSKDELENEIISLEDNSDEMIDLTGDHSDTKGDADTQSDRAKQLERRRRAAEFLRKVGVDPAAPLPASSLASAMVDTLESIRKKKAEEEEKRLKREKRRHREKHGHGEDGDRSHRKSKRRKYKSSEEGESDYDGSKKKKKKKDKKHSSKTKRKRRKEIEHEEIEEEEEDHPLPPNMDLTTTLKELRTSSPTKDLIQDVAEESQHTPARESSSEEEVVRRKKKKKEDREYSEGEWSSDSEADSEASSADED